VIILRENIRVLKIIILFGNVNNVDFVFKLHKLTIMNPIEEKRNLIKKKKKCRQTKDM